MQYKQGFESMRDITMYFHSSFRNVGLYISVALATFGASGYLKESINDYILMILTGIVLLLVSCWLNIYLFMRMYNLSNNTLDLNGFLMISLFVFIVQITILGINMVRLYNTYYPAEKIIEKA